MPEKAHIDKHARVTAIGAGISFAAFFMVIGYSSPFVAALGTATMLLFLKWSIFGGAICAAGFVALSGGSRVHFNKDLTTPALQLAIVLGAMMFMLCGVLCLIPIFLGTVNNLAVGFGGLLFGVGALATFLEWGTVCSPLSPRDTLFRVAWALIVMMALSLAVTYINALAAHPIAVYTALLLVSTAMLGYCAYRIEPVNEDITTRVTASEAVKSLWSVLWQPLVCAIIVVFIFGFLWDPAASGVDRGILTPAQLAIGTGVPSLCVLIFLHFSKLELQLKGIENTICPIAVLILLVSSYLPISGMGNFAVNTLDVIGFVFIAMVIWTSACAAVRATALSPQIVLPLTFGVIALAALIGAGLASHIGVHGQTIYFIVLALYLLTLIIASTYSNWRKRHSEQ